MTTTWQDCAQQFGDLMKLDRSWSFAVRVAAGCGPSDTGVKGTIAAFADLAGVSDTTLGRYLEAWDKAAAAGLVKPARQMVPADVDGFVPPEREFASFYNSSASGLYPKRVERIVELHGAEKIVAQLPDATRRALTDELVKQADPVEAYRLQQAATDRLADEHAEHRDRARTAEANQKAEREQRHGVRFIQGDSRLLSAAREMRAALEELRVVVTTEETRAIIDRRLAHIRSIADLIQFAAGNVENIDWDAELAKIGAEQ